MADGGLGKLFGEVHKPAALQRAVTEAKERERGFAQEKQKLLEQKKELTLLKKVQENFYQDHLEDPQDH